MKQAVYFAAEQDQVIETDSLTNIHSRKCVEIDAAGLSCLRYLNEA